MKPASTLRPSRPRARPLRGFTLIELMIVVVVISVLAAIAYPSYMSSVRKARRADAVDAAARIQQAQERVRANAANYVTTTANITVAQPTGLGLASANSVGNLYAMTLSTNSAVGCTTATCYQITATAIAGTSQAADTGCTAMVAAVAAGVPTYTPANCWSR